MPFQCALPYLQNNLYLLMTMSGIFGTLRVLGGIADGVLSGGALVLIAFAWFGSRPISVRRCSEPRGAVVRQPRLGGARGGRDSSMSEPRERWSRSGVGSASRRATPQITPVVDAVAD